MDDTAELEAWAPHGHFSTYPAKQAHSISCFIQMCGLAEILNQILIHFYSANQDLSLQRAYQCTVAEGSKLRDWWRDLPEHLKINLALPSVECPPSHIVTLKYVQFLVENQMQANNLSHTAAFTTPSTFYSIARD